MPGIFIRLERVRVCAVHHSLLHGVERLHHGCDGQESRSGNVRLETGSSSFWSTPGFQYFL